MMEFPPVITVWFCPKHNEAQLVSGFSDDEFDHRYCPACDGPLVKTDYKHVAGGV